MSEESKITEPITEDVHTDTEEVVEEVNADTTQTGASKKKKKKGGKKVKKAAASNDVESEALEAAETGESSDMGSGMVKTILKNNPSLAAETRGMDPKKIQEMLSRLKLEELMTGMVCFTIAVNDYGYERTEKLIEMKHRHREEKTRKIWRRTSSGLRNQFRDLVCTWSHVPWVGSRTNLSTNGR